MIIRQHGSSGELFDMNTFLSDVDKFFQHVGWADKPNITQEQTEIVGLFGLRYTQCSRCKKERKQIE